MGYQPLSKSAPSLSLWSPPQQRLQQNLTIYSTFIDIYRHFSTVTTLQVKQPKSEIFKSQHFSTFLDISRRVALCPSQIFLDISQIFLTFLDIPQHIANARKKALWLPTHHPVVIFRLLISQQCTDNQIKHFS